MLLFFPIAGGLGGLSAMGEGVHAQGVACAGGLLRGNDPLLSSGLLIDCRAEGGGWGLRDMLLLCSELTRPSGGGDDHALCLAAAARRHGRQRWGPCSWPGAEAQRGSSAP